MIDAPTKPVIVLMFANDLEGKRYLRNLAQEAESLRHALESTGQCEVVVRQNATPEMLYDVLQDARYRNRIAVLHYGGHANSHQLLFETPVGSVTSVGAAHLADFLREQAGLVLVFLNGCSTEEQAKGLLGVGVKAVIATSSSVPDGEAREFAERFYKGIAGGASLSAAYRQAVAALQAGQGGNERDANLDDQQVAPVTGRWHLYPPNGGAAKKWGLARAAGDPYFGLPGLPNEIGLPQTPYHRDLSPYRREDARVFFGRGWDVRKLYTRLIDVDRDPLVLLYGQSGVGKSSLLEAGLLPRLEAERAVCYVRRDGDLGLLGTLLKALGAKSEAEMGPKWREAERQAGKPLTVILDQAEEAYTLPNHMLPNEMATLAAALSAVLLNPASRPQGRLLLSFRKDWLADIETQMHAHDLQWSWVFLQRLDLNGIIEVVSGPTGVERLRDRYHLQVEEELPEEIAYALLADRDSPVAVTLQILMWNMWEHAVRRNRRQPRFDRALFDELRSEGLGLSDFLRGQLEALAAIQPEAVDSGLALDVLAQHTTEMNTAKQCRTADLEQTYGHRLGVLTVLLRAFQDLYLLADLAQDEPDAPSQSRLAHDTLAPLVRQRFAESDRPGQRARRILESRAAGWRNGREGDLLDDADLVTVEAGVAGMRALTKDEERLVAASRAASDERERARRRAQARSLAYQARLAVQLHMAPTVGLLLAVEAAMVSVPCLPVAQSALYASLGASGGVPLRGHGGPVNAVSFSYDNSRLVTGSDDGTVRLWDRANPDAALTVLNAHERPISSVAFSANGHWLATRHNGGGAVLWDLANPGATAVLSGYEGGVDALAFSPDSHWLVMGGTGGPVRMWDVTVPQVEPVNLAEHVGDIRALAFSPSGHWFASGSRDGTVRLWNGSDLGAGPAVLHCKGSVEIVAFSLDDRWLAAGSGEGTVWLWDPKHPGPEPLVLPAVHGGPLVAVAFSSDGRWLATNDDWTARVWDMTQTDVKPLMLSGHEGPVVALAFSPTAGYCLATASWDGTARLWDVTRPKAEPIVLRGHEGWVEAITFSSDGHWLATGSHDCTVRLWDVANFGSEPVSLPGHEGWVTEAAFSPDSRCLTTGCHDKKARVWKVQNHGLDLVAEVSHEGRVVSVVYSPDGHWLATGGDGKTRLWDLTDSNAVPFTLVGHEDGVTSMAFSPDSRWLATINVDDAAIRLWDMTSPRGGQIMLAGHEKGARSAVFSPDGLYLATGSDDRTARLWSVMNRGAEFAVLPGHEAEVTALAFSRDSRWLVTGTASGKVRLWETENRGIEPKLLAGHQGWVTAVAFSSDGRWLATSSVDTMARLWNVTSLESGPAVLSGHEGPVDTVAFSPDSRWLATACKRTVRLWDVTRQDMEPAILSGQQDDVAFEQVTALAFSCDGRWLATGGYRVVGLWTLQVEKLVDKARRAAGRNFTIEEWERYFPGELYRKTCPAHPVPQEVIESLLREGDHMAERGRVTEAIGRLIRAADLAPDLAANPEYMNALCWYGSLRGRASDVRFAGERAVALAPDHGGMRDTRGVARALTGDFTGAIEDFRAYVVWSREQDDHDANEIAQREAWIVELEAGRNPLDEATLNALREL